jgi:hypothetical protein
VTFTDKHSEAIENKVDWMVNSLLTGPIISRALNLLASLGFLEKRGNDWPVNYISF